jgi:hypothetical protein
MFFLRKDGWDYLGKWIEENEKHIINKNFTRPSINQFNYKILSNKLLALIDKNLK